MTRLMEQMSLLVGKSVKLGRGGPDVQRGTLVAVKDDYLAVFTADGALVYYPFYHLRSVTEISAEEVAESHAEKNGGGNQNGNAQGQGQDQGQGQTQASLSAQELDYVAALPLQFWEIMDAYKGMRVQVYDHGPEQATGFVFDVGEDYVRLVTDDDLVHFPIFHIRSFRLAAKPRKKENQDNKSQDNKEQDNSADNKGDNKAKSGDNKGSQGGVQKKAGYWSRN